MLRITKWDNLGARYRIPHGDHITYRRRRHSPYVIDTPAMSRVYVHHSTTFVNQLKNRCTMKSYKYGTSHHTAGHLPKLRDGIRVEITHRFGVEPEEECE